MASDASCGQPSPQKVPSGGAPATGLVTLVYLAASAALVFGILASALALHVRRLSLGDRPMLA